MCFLRVKRFPESPLHTIGVEVINSCFLRRFEVVIEVEVSITTSLFGVWLGVIAR